MQNGSWVRRVDFKDRAHPGFPFTAAKPCPYYNQTRNGQRQVRGTNENTVLEVAKTPSPQPFFFFNVTKFIYHLTNFIWGETWGQRVWVFTPAPPANWANWDHFASPWQSAWLSHQGGHEPRLKPDRCVAGLFSWSHLGPPKGVCLLLTLFIVDLTDQNVGSWVLATWWPAQGQPSIKSGLLKFVLVEWIAWKVYWRRKGAALPTWAYLFSALWPVFSGSQGPFWMPGVPGYFLTPSSEANGG